MLTPWKKSSDQPRQHIKKQRHYFTNKGLSSQSYGFSMVMYGCELDCEESWVPKNWCFWTVVLEKTLESPLDCRGSNQSILKEVSPKYSLEGLMLKLKLPILWPLDAKNWLIWKDPDAGKDWKREEKGTTEDEMVGWHHRLDGHELSKLQGLVKDREAWRAAVHGSQSVEYDWATEPKLKWTRMGVFN